MELIFLTLILGATVLLAFYISKIFKSEVFFCIEQKCWTKVYNVHYTIYMHNIAIKYTSITGKGGDDWSDGWSGSEIIASACSWTCCYQIKEEARKESKRKRHVQTPLAGHLTEGAFRHLLCVLKTYFRGTAGVLWTLTLALMEGTWPLVQRIRLLWFGAPSNWHWVLA